MGEQVSPWRRDAIASEVCACGHFRHVHNIDTAKQPCSTSACGCLLFRLAAHQYREHRTVTVPLPTDNDPEEG